MHAHCAPIYLFADPVTNTRPSTASLKRLSYTHTDTLVHVVVAVISLPVKFANVWPLVSTFKQGRNTPKGVTLVMNEVAAL